MAFYQTDSSGQIWRYDTDVDGSFIPTKVSSVSPSNPVPTTLALTGQSLVKAALENLGAVAPDETMEATDQTTGLSALNRMLDAWNTEKLISWALERKTFTLQTKNPHTIGLGADLDVVRPNDIKGGQAWIRTSDGQEYELDVLTHEEYGNLTGKTQSGLPCALWYDGSMPGNIYFDVVPDQAYTLILYLPRKLAQIADPFTEFSLPEGYAEAIEWNLTVRLAPKYSKSVDNLKVAVALAQESKANIKRANHRPVDMKSDMALFNRGSYDIKSGR